MDWKPPITKEAFLKMATEYGANRWLASDLWYFRPNARSNDCEDTLKINFEAMKADNWIQKNNTHAKLLNRHEFIKGTGAAGASGKCEYCDGFKRSAVHNTEPLQ